MLLSRYNVAQTQVALFDATRMVVHAQADFKKILKRVKFARLMHRIRKVKDGYEFEFDGPAFLLRNTRRYGIAVATFLPGLLSCRPLVDGGKDPTHDPASAGSSSARLELGAE